jgi:hypothetical protein
MTTPRRSACTPAFQCWTRRRSSGTQAGHYLTNLPAASVVKVLMADELLARGYIWPGATTWTAKTAWKMITQSDDTSFVALMNHYGWSTSYLLSRVSARYGIADLGSPQLSSKPSYCWGNTHFTPHGLARFYYHMQRDSRVAWWLVHAMHRFTTYGSDGTNQTFGIPSAATGVGVKQGWGGYCSSQGIYHSVINTTGLVGSDRFAVVIMTESTHWPNSNSYQAWLASVATHMAKVVIQRGSIQLP